MCGIAGIILKSSSGPSLGQCLRSFSKYLKHRGPDGEGFMVARGENAQPYFEQFKLGFPDPLPYLPKEVLPEDLQYFQLGFLHRRLSILDLSEKAHQPMCDPKAKLWITYNGEIYNYRELKVELLGLGHHFISGSDTEVILSAYRQWGEKCVEKFNGMWSFCIYDIEKQICFASRDRLGVKPFYYCNSNNYFAFASEQKALVKAGLSSGEVHQKALHNYLLNAQLENEPQNFFSDITELWPGTNLIYDLKGHRITLQKYYDLEEHLNLNNEKFSDDELVLMIRGAVQESVQLRLRSDVEVGCCLSGGIDSSVIALNIAATSKTPLHCFTSVFKGTHFNEEHFADLVAQKISAKHHKIEPTFEGLRNELDTLIYSQDVPIWDTSTYAQYKVMELSKLNSIKVVLDGQGADELFGGYHHHYLAVWNQYFRDGNITGAFKNILNAGKSIRNPFLFFVKERLKQRYHFQLRQHSAVFRSDFIGSFPTQNPSLHFEDLNKQLLHDIYQTRLKSFLKCEDRCGMWHSVESRVPFSDDVNLIELAFSFNGKRKIQNGISKYLLRETMKNELPEEIYRRHDKKGFDTPIQDWLSQMRPELLEEIQAAGLDFLKPGALFQGKENSASHNKTLFRLYVYCRWKKLFSEPGTIAR